ncbi:hypothetical protein [Dictyobacter formicarum]|uniref:Uncharacterized protein n=1 Tax=Dictyobacter formicarum TaxID=2778368 RepID=A0ABQ3VID8_9CHLR|nr:hypothetical protein [Dictyobacter formicarum]GHO84886.1 hypothetical protein KSZ_28920 [Dictyobacter formicarum]
MGNDFHLNNKVIPQIKRVFGHGRLAILGTLFFLGIVAAVLAFMTAFFIINLLNVAFWSEEFSFFVGFSALLLGPCLW